MPNEDTPLLNFASNGNEDCIEESGASSSRKKQWTFTRALIVLLTVVLLSFSYHSVKLQDRNAPSEQELADFFYPLDHAYQDSTSSEQRRPVLPRRPKLNIENLHEPFSSHRPVEDLKLFPYDRPDDSKPSQVLKNLIRNQAGSNASAHSAAATALPTNAWYQNLLLLNTGKQPGETNRAYPIPYIVDVAGPIPGLRVHPNHINSFTTEVHVDSIPQNGLTLGATPVDHKMANERDNATAHLDMAYAVVDATSLGITLEWNAAPMRSSIVRGMPYATMTYQDTSLFTPTIASEIGFYYHPTVDPGNTSSTLNCTSEETVIVERELEMFFPISDFTWLAFVSRPVAMRCVLDKYDGGTRVQVVDDTHNESPLTIRIALFRFCTTNANPIYCHAEQMDPVALHLGQGRYLDLLRKGANIYPGSNTSVTHRPINGGNDLSMVFDWDAVRMRDDDPGDSGLAFSNSSELIMFALPHHWDQLQDLNLMTFPEKYCAHSLLGPACLVMGNTWTLRDDVPTVGMRAPRPPAQQFWRHIMDGLSHDLKFELPPIFKNGTGDTYFSGKMLAKLARICLIADEMQELCENNGQECVELEYLPQAIEELGQSVQIWINGSAQTPFVYDAAWGGVVSCGCKYNETTESCNSKFPDCPAFSDPLLNFGNAFYNDNHFHYGYHIYAAAVMAHFDPAWGRKHFEQVLYLIRTIANPSNQDMFFTRWRHKDWYQGHSWASGISTVFLNGRNQESSSESVAAYEAITLFGRSMKKAWLDAGNQEKAIISQQVEETGLYLTASELRSTKKYYHVEELRQFHGSSPKIYPSNYKKHVIGIMWQTLAQFQTWFGGASYMAIGIQLLPITPIAEERDTLLWLQELYRDFADSCESQAGCKYTGWRILQLAALASIGYQATALDEVEALSSDVFEDPGGNGQSLTNTIWFIATRPLVKRLIPIHQPVNAQDFFFNTSAEEYEAPSHVDLQYCGIPSCTDHILDTIADLYTCRQRITWLIEYQGWEVKDACVQVSAHQFPRQCGFCSPTSEFAKEGKDSEKFCTRCTPFQCDSPLNRCPKYEQSFVCTKGPNQGGCSDTPWEEGPLCEACCELTDCPELSRAEIDEVVYSYEGDLADNCPSCTKKQCALTQCPYHSAPYACLNGTNMHGCSFAPWSLDGGDCVECCKLTADCFGKH